MHKQYNDATINLTAWHIEAVHLCNSYSLAEPEIYFLSKQKVLIDCLQYSAPT